MSLKTGWSFCSDGPVAHHISAGRNSVEKLGIMRLDEVWRAFGLLSDYCSRRRILLPSAVSNTAQSRNWSARRSITRIDGNCIYAYTCPHVAPESLQVEMCAIEPRTRNSGNIFRRYTWICSTIRKPLMAALILCG